MYLIICPPVAITVIQATIPTICHADWSKIITTIIRARQQNVAQWVSRYFWILLRWVVVKILFYCRCRLRHRWGTSGTQVDGRRTGIKLEHDWAAGLRGGRRASDNTDWANCWTVGLGPIAYSFSAVLGGSYSVLPYKNCDTKWRFWFWYRASMFG